MTKTESFQTQIRRVTGETTGEPELDAVAVEEPLEIRLGFTENGRRAHRAVSITMRTPGEDHALAAGFLFTEGIVKSAAQIAEIKFCGRFPNDQNTVRVDLKPEVSVELKKLTRNFYTTSSCGVCGKSSLEALNTAGARRIESEGFPQISVRVIHQLPETLRAKQKVFDRTGGLHAAALFGARGDLFDLKEDVGRHNAVDKLIGAQMLAGKTPLADKILFLSGRASFELVQKAVMAGIPAICAVGAPSSLAIEAAREFNISLIGFVRDRRFNVYAGGERLIYETPLTPKFDSPALTAERS